MRVHQVIQGSDEWRELRAGKVTASELHNIITPKKREYSEGAGMRTYRNKLLWERWSGMPIESYSGGAMERRGGFEGEARGAYQIISGNQVRQVGFITTDDGRFGLSPDGLIERPGQPWYAEHDGGLELKAPEAWTQFGWILNGGLPDDHFMQVHGSMYGTGANWWVFMAWCRGIQPIIVKVQRDPLIIADIEKAVTRFNDELDRAWDKLVRHNGGPPDVKDFMPLADQFAEASAPAPNIIFDPSNITAAMSDEQFFDFIASGQIPVGPESARSWMRRGKETNDTSD